DTRHLVESILREPGGYSWQILNWKIAIRELAVSGCDFMPAFRYKKRLQMLRNLLFGNRALVRNLLRDCSQDFIVAQSLDELTDRMNAASLYELEIDRDQLKSDVRDFDAELDKGAEGSDDEQVRRLAEFRTYFGDRIRICRNQKIDDPDARPLIAIREFILARKSLGGIQTDMGSRVLSKSGKPVTGLYAVGESAGFGGGGIHGKRSLEGTFLGACILTGRVAGKTIASGG
ncbi:MAG: FAD-binding protein, partial [Candidatus Latescibacterota bacterium]